MKDEKLELPPYKPTITEPEEEMEEQIEQGELEELLQPPPQEMLQLIEPSEEPNKSAIVPAEITVAKQLARQTGGQLTQTASPKSFSSPTTNEQQNQMETLDVLPSPGAAGSDAEDNPEQEKAGEAGRIEWIFKDGKWVPVEVAPPAPSKPAVQLPPEEIVKPIEEKMPEELEWEEALAVEKTRVIKIPTDKLLAGDPRYNIVIRPGDNIYVPVDIIGEFCIMGNVNRQGYINLTGRPMTLKMAIAAAGGLGPLAWPKRVEVVRRIGRNKEEIVMVDLDKIARGEQPDFFIKPDDLINVGTHPTSRWRERLRNAFRATWGFGFDWDMNFADKGFGRSYKAGRMFEVLIEQFGE